MSVEEIKDKIRPVLRKHDVCKASFFGSVTRGEATDKSDIDLLVEFEGEQYVEGTTRERFLDSTQLQDAVIRRIEIIGEAIKNVPPQMKDRYPDIPWKRIAGMRDILIHEYFGVDLNLTWKVATAELDELRKKMLEIKQDLQARGP